MNAEKLRAGLWGAGATALLAALIAVGSRRLAHFDAALVCYTFATLFALFGIVYRYAMWLQRPPTAMLWRRSWGMLAKPRNWARAARHLLRRVPSEFVLNRFIFRRNWRRGAAHLLLMWGCLIAFAITFPLVFGWIHFDTLPDDFTRYRIFLFGFPTQVFSIESSLGFIIFHGLVWSSFLVIAGVMIAMRRRLIDHGAAAVQLFSEDFMPLILLFAISVTGLMLTASASWMQGYAYDFLSILHAITVIFTLLWMPFGKFFHIVQRPAQIGASLYREIGAAEAMAQCRRCGKPFAPQCQVEDLIIVERQLGYRYEMDAAAGHYQWICPRCRRLLPALAQGRLIAAAAEKD